MNHNELIVKNQVEDGQCAHRVFDSLHGICGRGPSKVVQHGLPVNYQLRTNG